MCRPGAARAPAAKLRERSAEAGPYVAPGLGQLRKTTHGPKAPDFNRMCAWSKAGPVWPNLAKLAEFDRHRPTSDEIGQDLACIDQSRPNTAKFLGRFAKLGRKPINFGQRQATLPKIWSRLADILPNLAEIRKIKNSAQIWPRTSWGKLSRPTSAKFGEAGADRPRAPDTWAANRWRMGE